MSEIDENLSRKITSSKHKTDLDTATSCNCQLQKITFSFNSGLSST